MLSGKTAVITGAAKGIGRAIAERFAAEGCNIVLNYRSNIDDEVIEKIKSFGVECLPFKADISNFNEAEELIKTAKNTPADPADCAGYQHGTVDVGGIRACL